MDNDEKLTVAGCLEKTGMNHADACVCLFVLQKPSSSRQDFLTLAPLMRS